MGVVLSVLNDHIFRWVQRFLAIEPHNLGDGTTNVNHMETEAGAGSCIVLLLEREAGVELGCCLQAQFATSFDLSSLVNGPAGVQALILLLICQDAERMVAAIGAHFVLSALDEFLAVAVPLDLWERSTNNSTSQSARFAKFGGCILDFFLQNWRLANCRKTCNLTLLLFWDLTCNDESAQINNHIISCNISLYNFKKTQSFILNGLNGMCTNINAVEQ